jgi:hypothetical protein
VALVHAHARMRIFSDIVPCAVSHLRDLLLVMTKKRLLKPQNVLIVQMTLGTTIIHMHVALRSCIQFPSHLKARLHQNVRLVMVCASTFVTRERFEQVDDNDFVAQYRNFCNLETSYQGACDPRGEKLRGSLLREIGSELRTTFSSHLELLNSEWLDFGSVLQTGANRCNSA